MLGKEIGEERGQITGMRVLPQEGGMPGMEVSFQAQGHVLDVDITDNATYVARPRPDGTFYGEGQGVYMTPDGEMATWVGQGVGIPGKGGSMTWRGALYASSASEKLAALNKVCLVYEFSTDESGKAEGKTWEWK